MNYKHFPSDLIPLETTISLNQPSFSFESEFTGVEQNIYHPGARWVIEMNFNTLTEQKWRRLSVFLNDLQGKSGVFAITDHSREGTPAKGTPYVSGDGQTGRQLVTAGWNPRQLVLKLGDLITVNDELKEVNEDVWSDAIGAATFTFNPPLRKSPPNSEPIVTINPYVVVRLDMDSVARTNQAMQLATFDKLKFSEVIYK
ncbi:MAG: hypothetical protein ACTH6I_07160 [Vibrio litoralis]|uniref:hypothetical protein n=1 Tax=Vibrio litoralis TaxID=335972 RepID=UPI003F9D868F